MKNRNIMEESKIEFIKFDPKDVITTSTPMKGEENNEESGYSQQSEMQSPINDQKFF